MSLMKYVDNSNFAMNNDMLDATVHFILSIMLMCIMQQGSSVLVNFLSKMMDVFKATMTKKKDTLAIEFAKGSRDTSKITLLRSFTGIFYLSLLISGFIGDQKTMYSLMTITAIVSLLGESLLVTTPSQVKGTDIMVYQPFSLESIFRSKIQSRALLPTTAMIVYRGLFGVISRYQVFQNFSVRESISTIMWHIYMIMATSSFKNGDAVVDTVLNTFSLIALFNLIHLDSRLKKNQTNETEVKSAEETNQSDQIWLN